MNDINRVYIASTPYHILCTIDDLMNRSGRGILVLVSNFNSDFEYFKKIKKRIETLNKIDEVIVVKPRAKLSRLFGYGGTYKKIKDFDIKTVVIFPWNLQRIYTNANYFFAKFRGKVSIFMYEDGSNVFLSNKPVSLLKRVTWFLFRIQRFPSFVKDVDKFFLSYPEKFPKEIRKKAEHVSLISNISNYSDSQKNFIRSVFMDKEENERLNNILNIKEKNILFTQPLAKDGFMTEKEQKLLYNSLISKYSNYAEPLVIKKHPRDDLQYDLNVNCLLIDGHVPSEVLRMLNTGFKLSIGINSSAIRSVISKEYLELGANGYK